MALSSDVANAVVTAVTALALTGATVVRRKTPSVPEGATADWPQVVVSVGEEGAVSFFDFENNVLVRYPVAVTIVTDGGAKLADDDTIRTWRESVRRKCHDRATYAGVTGFLDVAAVGETPFDPAALARDFNYSVLVFTVAVVESRIP